MSCCCCCWWLRPSTGFPNDCARRNRDINGHTLSYPKLWEQRCVRVRRFIFGVRARRLAHVCRIGTGGYIIRSDFFSSAKPRESHAKLRGRFSCLAATKKKVYGTDHDDDIFWGLVLLVLDASRILGWKAQDRFIVSNIQSDNTAGLRISRSDPRTALPRFMARQRDCWIFQHLGTALCIMAHVRQPMVDTGKDMAHSIPLDFQVRSVPLHRWHAIAPNDQSHRVTSHLPTTTCISSMSTSHPGQAKQHTQTPQNPRNNKKTPFPRLFQPRQSTEVETTWRPIPPKETCPLKSRLP